MGYNSLAVKADSTTSMSVQFKDVGTANDAGVLLKNVIKMELNESRTWLKIIAEAGYVGKSSLAALIAESEELTRIMSASVITARKGLE